LVSHTEGGKQAERVFENRVLRRIFGYKRVEVPGEQEAVGNTRAIPKSNSDWLVKKKRVVIAPKRKLSSNK
jgi:hypothetical protein